MYVSFDEWTQNRHLPSLGTNAGAIQLPFQQWRNFKEAFAPELVRRAIDEAAIDVKRCLDPFGGSGTTALTCQFLGVHPISIEVNPYLADLIEAKLCFYSADKLASDLGGVVRRYGKSRRTASTVFSDLPLTFIEPGSDGRWIFDRAIADRIAKLVSAISETPDARNRRFFRVILGGILIDVSNVIVSGKGRRYRRNWQTKSVTPKDVLDRFCDAAQTAISEVRGYSKRAVMTYDLYRGDARKLVNKVQDIDLCVFSPPYPNSFDYTDIYNVELWMLGYLKSAAQNKKLRTSTLPSHVQIKRTFAEAPDGSKLLERVLKKLKSARDDLWDSRIPDMVGAYFHDLSEIISNVSRQLSHKGEVWIVVGDSRYAGINIPAADILDQLLQGSGLKTKLLENCRSMRSSAQQGGQSVLAENLLVLSKC